jgi:hypothetical protein
VVDHLPKQAQGPEFKSQTGRGGAVRKLRQEKRAPGQPRLHGDTLPPKTIITIIKEI